MSQGVKFRMLCVDMVLVFNILGKKNLVPF